MPVAKKIAQALGAENYNILQNNGRLAHQEVDHVCGHHLFRSLANTNRRSYLKDELTSTGPFPCNTKTRPGTGSRDKLASTEDRHGRIEVIACGSEEQDVRLGMVRKLIGYTSRESLHTVEMTFSHQRRAAQSWGVYLISSRPNTRVCGHNSRTRRSGRTILDGLEKVRRESLDLLVHSIKAIVCTVVWILDLFSPSFPTKLAK